MSFGTGAGLGSGAAGDATRVGILSDALLDSARKRSQRRLNDSKVEVEHLTLVVDAMWSLLAERLNLTNDDLLARIDELDLADGVLDGRRQPAPAMCTGCEAAIPPGRPNCQFCGTPSPDRDPFT
jgi:hypothetical protein